MTVIQGQLVGTGLRMAIVAGRFNDLITRKLLEGCQDTLYRHGVTEQNMTIVWVPGAFEIPYAARQLKESRQYDAIICLGCVIRGGTPHFEYVAGETAKGISTLNNEGNVPVIFGVLTTNTLEQALDRAGAKSGNKGSDAAMTAIEMATLTTAIERHQAER
jgi:6,7-dimethyl-8-ribityllumazine synthase